MTTIINLNAHADAILEAAKSPMFIRAHRDCMENWTSEDRVAEMENYGLYSGPLDGWRFTSSDYWAMEINHRIEAAAEAGDEDAWECRTLMGAALIMGEMEADEAVIKALWKAADMLEVKWHPAGVDSLVPCHSCHFTWPLSLLLARKIFPETKWIPMGNELHSFVQADDGRIFDLLLHDIEQPDSNYFQHAKPLLDMEAP